MTPFYQIRSREHEKSESGLHGKSRICPRYTGFSGIDEAKIRLFAVKMKNVKLDRQVFVFIIFYPIRLKNDDVSVKGFPYLVCNSQLVLLLFSFHLK